MQKSGKAIMKIFLAIFVSVLCLLPIGCGSTKFPESTGKGTIQYVTKDNRMERVLFADGFLRSTPEIASGTIVANVYKGSQGMLYGKRFINGMYWAKVTTREGVTGWYSAGDKEGVEANADLSTLQKNYSMTYPVVSGISEDAAKKINGEITAYLKAFKYVAGPVGNTLQCRVTYNANNLLSILFTAGAVRNRSYKITDINNAGFWSTITKYCFIPELHSDVDKGNMLAPITDLQYGMVFSLTTGDRLSYLDFIGQEQKNKVAALLNKSGKVKQNGTECFYVEPGQKLWVFVGEESSSVAGLKLVDISSLVTKKY